MKKTVLTLFIVSSIWLPGAENRAAKKQNQLPLLEAFPLGKVILEQGEEEHENLFIRNREKFIRVLAQTNPDNFLFNFRDTFGQPQPQGAVQLGGWDDQTTRLRGHASGHYLSAIAQAFAGSAYDPILQKIFLKKIDAMVDTLYDLAHKSGRPREPGGPFVSDPRNIPVAKGNTTYNSDLSRQGIRQDYWNWGHGFISAYPPDQFIMLENGAGYGSGNHQVWAPYYTLHKILAGLLDCYELAGKTKALVIVENMADWITSRLSVLSPATRNDMWSRYIAGEFGGINEVLARLYRLTGKQDYLDCARYFDNTAFFFGDLKRSGGLAANQDTLGGKHANQHIPQITGALEIYKAGGEKIYYQVARHFWAVCTSGYGYSIGGVAGARNPDNPECFTIKRDSLFHNGFSPKGQNETCATYNLLKLSRQLFLFHPDGAYMDYYERALYNHILASVAEKDPGNTYHVPLHPGAQKEFGNAQMDGFSCCNGTALESNTKFQDSIYFKGVDNQSIYVNLFIPSTVYWEERSISLRQETRYPYEDRSTLVVSGTGQFQLKVRAPSWASTGISVQINGEQQSNLSIRDGYISIGSSWKDGDRIHIRIPFSFRLMPLSDQPNIASIFYGPILLAAEEKQALDHWHPLNLDKKDISRSIRGNPSTLHFTVDAVSLKPFFEIYNRHSVYFDISRH